MTTIVNGAAVIDNPNPVISNATQAAMIMYTYRCAPALGVTNAVHTAITGSTATTTVVTTSINAPDFPRVLTITGSTASLTGNVVIAGTDQKGAVVSDTIALSGVSTVVGAGVFTAINTITLPVLSVAAATVAIGTANVIGFPAIVKDANYILKQTFNGTTDAGTFAANATTLSLNKYTPAGTLDGSKVLALLAALY